MTSATPRGNGLGHRTDGVNVAFRDGSVRFVKSTIAVNTWRALSTMAGGEVISAEAY